MTGRCELIAALMLSLPNNVAHGHHAFSPVYDASRTVTIKGTLTDFKLVNPHATMTVDVVDETGKHVVWTVEMAGLLSLTRQGWTEKSVSVGEQLTVTGNPTHTGSPRMAFDRLVLANGTELLDPGENNQSTIEEQRRERARQRQQQK
jgi:hypothetical protein